jgi:AraC-like DNA-binding protein
VVIQYNAEQLSSIIDDIFVLTGISISILDTNRREVATSKKKSEYCSLLQSITGEQRRCLQCDKKILDRCLSTKTLEHHICRAGLYDSAMPIIKDDAIVGFVIMGQVRSIESPAAVQYLPRADVQTLEQLKRFYANAPFLSKELLDALYDLLPRILFDRAIRIVYDPLISEIVNFIDGHLQESLSIERLCAKFYISKNHLYEAFRINLGNTVTGYINEQRIFLAKELLRQSDKPMSVIAEQIGINNYTYFFKLFKKLTGTTPTEYRNGG